MVEPAEPHIPKHVEIRVLSHNLRGGDFTFDIDGEPFPYHIVEGSMVLKLDQTVPQITFAIFADKITALTEYRDGMVEG